MANDVVTILCDLRAKRDSLKVLNEERAIKFREWRSKMDRLIEEKLRETQEKINATQAEVNAAQAEIDQLTGKLLETLGAEGQPQVDVNASLDVSKSQETIDEVPTDVVPTEKPETVTEEPSLPDSMSNSNVLEFDIELPEM